jgi:hypothetical protein
MSRQILLLAHMVLACAGSVAAGVSGRTSWAPVDGVLAMPVESEEAQARGESACSAYAEARLKLDGLPDGGKRSAKRERAFVEAQVRHLLAECATSDEDAARLKGSDAR